MGYGPTVLVLPRIGDLVGVSVEVKSPTLTMKRGIDSQQDLISAGINVLALRKSAIGLYVALLREAALYHFFDDGQWHTSLPCNSIDSNT